MAQPAPTGWLLALADFLANHGLPTLAAFVAGWAGGEARLRWRAWRRRKR